MSDILQHWWSRFSDNMDLIMVIGLVGQIAFTARFVVQWIASEKAGRSVVPVAFWYLSLAGATLLFAYALFRADPVFILGQSLGFFIYSRNLVLIRREANGAEILNG